MSKAGTKIFHPEVQEALLNVDEVGETDHVDIMDTGEEKSVSGEQGDEEVIVDGDDDDESDNQDDDDQSDDSYEGGNVALAYDINQLSGGDGLPQNGHDYLKLVQEEREKYPAVTFAKPPTTADQNKSAKEKQSSSQAPNTVSSPQSLVKSSNSDLKYRSEILNHFRKLKEKIEDLRESGNQQSMPSTLKLNKLMELGQSPKLSSIIFRTQLELHQALEILSDQCSLSPTMHLDWIYSIMAALREPIEADICSTLRKLARICIARRVWLENNREMEKEEVEVASGEAEDEEEEYRSCLLVICIVRHYFGQADLK